MRFARASVRRGGEALPRRAGGAAPDLSTFRADHRPAQSRGNSLPWCWVGDKRSASDRRAVGESAGGEGAGRYTSHILPCLSLESPLSGVHPLCRCSLLACHSSDAGAHANKVCISAPLLCSGGVLRPSRSWRARLVVSPKRAEPDHEQTAKCALTGWLRKPPRADLWSGSKGALIRRCATCAPRPAVEVRRREPWAAFAAPVRGSRPAEREALRGVPRPCPGRWLRTWCGGWRAIARP
ncbi:hypothetical protein D3C80_859170 [compost metagenome]